MTIMPEYHSLRYDIPPYDNYRPQNNRIINSNSLVIIIIKVEISWTHLPLWGPPWSRQKRTTTRNHGTTTAIYPNLPAGPRPAISKQRHTQITSNHPPMGRQRPHSTIHRYHFHPPGISSDHNSAA